MFGTYSMSLGLCMLLVVLGFEQATWEKTFRFIKTKLCGLLKNLDSRSYIGFSVLNSPNLLNVDFKVKQLCLSHVHKIFNGTGPSYLSEHFIRASVITITSLEVVLKTL